jgi:acyl-CoA thioesterase I
LAIDEGMALECQWLGANVLRLPAAREISDSFRRRWTVWEKSMRSRFNFVVRSLRLAILALLSAALIAPAPWCVAHAQSVRIVALGGSNTAGEGVGRNAAWPARLEALLRGEGIDATVINAGINGDTTAGMRARLGSAAPAGRKVVILDKAPANVARNGVDSASNMAGIIPALQARRVELIIIPSIHIWANRQLQADRLHITAAGHAAVAAQLPPLAVAAIHQ